MFRGLYKVEFETPRRKAVGVIYANEGKLYGGSATFAYVGWYKQDGHSISGIVTTKRHTENPNDQPVFGLDGVRITFSGVEKGGFATIDGTADEVPALEFKAVLTLLSE